MSVDLLEEFEDPPPGEELGEWEELTNPRDGSLYYHNRLTGVTQWDPPLWVDARDAVSGRMYWYNSQSRKTVWERPPDFVPIIRESRVEVPPGDIVDHAPTAGGGGAGTLAVVEVRGGVLAAAAVAAAPEENYDDDFEDAAGEHVEAIVGHRMKGGHRQYMVHWFGSSPEDDEWFYRRDLIAGAVRTCACAVCACACVRACVCVCLCG